MLEVILSMPKKFGSPFPANFSAPLFFFPASSYVHCRLGIDTDGILHEYRAPWLTQNEFELFLSSSTPNLRPATTPLKGR